jgi:hypothetical protein
MSQVANQTLEYQFTRPDGWIILPTSEEFTDPAWIDEVLDRYTLTAGGRTRLEQELARVALLAAKQNQPLRRRWVFVPDGATGIVYAVLSIDLMHGTGATQEALLEGLRTAEDAPGTSTWESAFDSLTLAGRPAVSGHRLLVTETTTGDQQMNDFYTAIIITPRPGTILRAEISTPDLSLFDDITASGNAILDGISFTPGVAA